MSKQTTWTVIVVWDRDEVKITRGLTLREALSLLKILQSDNYVADNPPNPWARIARQKAQEITEDNQFTTAFNKVFSLTRLEDDTRYGCYGGLRYISKIEIISEDGTKLTDVWPAPEDLVDKIVSYGLEMIDRRRRLSWQLIKWFDRYSKIPFAKRPNFVFEDTNLKREIYKVKP